MYIFLVMVRGIAASGLIGEYDPVHAFGSYEEAKEDIKRQQEDDIINPSKTKWEYEIKMIRLYN